MTQNPEKYGLESTGVMEKTPYFPGGLTWKHKLGDSASAHKLTQRIVQYARVRDIGTKDVWEWITEQALNSNQILVPDNLNWNSTPPTLPDINGRYKIPKPGITQIS